VVEPAKVPKLTTAVAPHEEQTSETNLFAHPMGER
jgi:hypothetical protein